MSIALRVAIVAALVALATAQRCNGNVTLANPYHRSNCTGYVMCERQLCTCAGAPTTNVTTDLCVRNATVGCEAFTLCLRNFMGCLDSLTSARSNASDPCNMWAVTLHAQLLQTVLTAYNGSRIQEFCAERACQLRNFSGMDLTCDMGVNFTKVCIPRSVTVRLIVATLRLGGSAFAGLINTPAGRERVRVALVTDIAALLKIDPRFVEILSFRIGSLIVEFAITEGANKSATSMLEDIATVGTSTSWLSSMTTLYREVSNETLTVEGFTAAIATTTGPGGVTPPPAPPVTARPATPAGGVTTTVAPRSLSGASTVSTLVVVAAAALALLL